MTLFAIWCAAGFIGFWVDRFVWGLEFGCKPVTVGTLLGSVLCSVGGPVCWVMAAVSTVLWLFRGKGRRHVQFLLTPLNRVVFNPWYYGQMALLPEHRVSSPALGTFAFLLGALMLVLFLSLMQTYIQ